jgi:hypothetical protein
MKWAGHDARVEKMRYPFTFMVRKPKGRDHMEAIRGWEDNININLRGEGFIN